MLFIVQHFTLAQVKKNSLIIVHIWFTLQKWCNRICFPQRTLWQHSYTRNDIRFLSWRRCSSPIFHFATVFHGVCTWTQDVCRVRQYCGCVKPVDYPLDDVSVWLKNNTIAFSIIFHIYPQEEKGRKEPGKIVHEDCLIKSSELCVPVFASGR